MHSKDKELQGHDNSHEKTHDQNTQWPNFESDKTEESRQSDSGHGHAYYGHPRTYSKKEI